MRVAYAIMGSLEVVADTLRDTDRSLDVDLREREACCCTRILRAEA